MISFTPLRASALAAGAAMLLGGAPLASASPPQKPASTSQKRPPNLIQAIGNFFSRSAARGSSPAPRRSATNNSGNSVPLYQGQANPASITQTPVSAPSAPSDPGTLAASTTATSGEDGDTISRSQLSLTVIPGEAPVNSAVPVETRDSASRPDKTSTDDAASEITVNDEARGKRTATSAPSPKPERLQPLPPIPEEPLYATPVIGRPGFVHPPGLNDPAVVVDVRQFEAGQKVRDPRTGNVFLVPPL